MKRQLTWVALPSMVVLAIAGYMGHAQARQTGFSGTTLALGRFGDIDTRNHQIAVSPNETDGPAVPWISFQRTQGPSDLYVQTNVWAAGGSTGWHSHPGHSLIIVTAGTVKTYDHDCNSREYTVGQGFVDEGGDHVHVIRNEGLVEARTIAVQLIPAGAGRRIPADAPDNCPVF
jgi:quercetin dioxygenase-like cupin family protein